MSVYNVRRVLELIHRYHFRPTSASPGYGYCYSSKVTSIMEYGHSRNQGLQMFSAKGETWKNINSKKVIDIKDGKATPPAHNTPKFNFSTWAKWVLGSLLSLLLPFWKQKREKLKTIEGQAETVIEEVETVAAAVEKAATMAEKLSADMAQKLPDNGRLKKAAVFVEHISKVTANDAQLTKDIIHKVEELKQDLDDLENMVEPAIEKLIQHKTQVK